MAPAIIGRLGPVRALFFAQTTYVLFAAANFLLECGYFLRGQLLLPAALGVGLTCSTLWAAQGMYVNNISQRYDALREGDGTTNPRDAVCIENTVYCGPFFLQCTSL